MRYFRYDWDGRRGDEFDVWGAITFWFEMDDDGYATRQMEVYENGSVLKYDALHSEDRYGFLPYVLMEPDEYQVPEVTAAEFEAAWAKLTALNTSAV